MKVWIVFGAGKHNNDVVSVCKDLSLAKKHEIENEDKFLYGTFVQEFEVEKS